MKQTIKPVMEWLLAEGGWDHLVKEDEVNTRFTLHKKFPDKTQRWATVIRTKEGILFNVGICCLLEDYEGEFGKCGVNEMSPVKFAQWVNREADNLSVETMFKSDYKDKKPPVEEEEPEETEEDLLEQLEDANRRSAEGENFHPCRQCNEWKTEIGGAFISGTSDFICNDCIQDSCNQ